MLRDVPAPVPFDIAEFCRRLSDRRGRPLVLVPKSSREMPEAVGLLVVRDSVDEVHYEADTSAYHQAIILHEVGHLLCDHGDELGGEPDFPLELLGSDWNPEVVRRLKRRHRYHDDQEREAEGFATAVLDHVDRQPQPAAGLERQAGASAPEQQRLSSMFKA